MTFVKNNKNNNDFKNSKYFLEESKGTNPAMPFHKASSRAFLFLDFRQGGQNNDGASGNQDVTFL